MSTRLSISTLGLALPLIAQVPASAQDPTTSQAVPGDLDLEELSLEELLEVPVEVGSRQSQSLNRTAASVFVLTEQDIQRSGMRSVPEVLRLVPGLIVSQDVPGAYGFSSRLGEYEFAGMLVLIDGQRLYTTLLRREYWQAIDLPLEVIKRIEVVRGPGGSRWGDKASQGVINIVTKQAAERGTGLRVSGWNGSEERWGGSFRYDQQLSETSGFYLYGKLARRDGGYPDVSGDHWTNNMIGGRYDSDLDEGTHLSVDGAYHDSFLGDSYEVAPGFSSLNDIKGGHIKTKLHIDHDDKQWTEWRAALEGYDQDIRQTYFGPYEHLRWHEELFDTMLMHSWSLAEGHQLTAGIALRSLTVKYWLVISDYGDEVNETRGDTFLSWDWDLCDELRLTLGGNIGYEDGDGTTGFETQPDCRLSWQPRADTTLWAALSSNREPDQRYVENNYLVKQKSSRLTAAEAGIRQRFGDCVLFRANAFAYQIEDQLNGYTTEPISGAMLPQSGGRTDAFGGELHTSWKPHPDVHFTAWLAHTEADSDNIDPSVFSIIRDNVPRLRGGATADYEVVPGLELGCNVLYTQSWANVRKWWRVDLRCAWRVSSGTSVELVGQNLTDPRHQEYYFDERIQRGGYFMVTHQF